MDPSLCPKLTFTLNITKGKLQVSFKIPVVPTELMLLRGIDKLCLRAFVLIRHLSMGKAPHATCRIFLSTVISANAVK